MDSIEILEKLIAFPTVSSDSNLALIRYAADLLAHRATEFALVESPDGRKASLFATTGPSNVPGVMLSGHTDVVPAAGQDWTFPPFEMTRHDGKLYGRGAADMKGFVACALAAFLKAGRASLARPLQLALSYDEEVGCLGVRGLIDFLRQSSVRPSLCIVGEPTSMKVAAGHKGKIAARAVCVGREGHSARAPLALNAIHLACDFIAALRKEQQRLAREGVTDYDYEVPYSTVHVGRINGGVALNIVPNRCEIEFEIRNVAAGNAEDILDNLRKRASSIAEQAQRVAPAAAIEIAVITSYPELTISTQAVDYVRSLTGANDIIKVDFGTEGGLLSRDLGAPSVICGPGSMDQGHKPDEFVSVEQIRKCDDMLNRLITRLASE